MKVQPTKIILINSANCQYAEFDLSDSLHFVARNNYGKTSIINTLQFLYIDSQKDIDLGYTLDESWKHYFPSLGSYVLFEINTLTGKKVFGLAATGLGSQPEKFLYNGAYQVEDFIDQNKGHYVPKKPENLFPQLSTKLVSRKMEAKNHRDLLRPFQQKKNPSGLGLIGDTRDYRLFKHLFRQLLQLKSITIKNLKTQIERVNHRVMEKDQLINVQREFNEPYSEIQKHKGELLRLQDNQRNIGEVLELSKQQKKLQGRLVSYFLKSTALFVSEEKQLNEQTQIYNDKIVRLKEEKLPEINQLREEKQQGSNNKNQTLGVIKDNIQKYQQLEDECLQVVIELEEKAMQNLKQQEEHYREQLFNARDENLDQLEKTLEFKRDQLDSKQRQLDGIADTLFAQLKKGLDDEELRQLYQISNPELWTLFKDNDYTLHDSEAFQSFLKASLKQQIKGTVCELPGLTLQLSGIATNTLYEMGDPDFLSDKIQEIEQDIAQTENKLVAVREQEKIRTKLLETQGKIKSIEKKMERYKQWEDGKEQFQEWRNERDSLKKTITEIQQEIDELDKQKMAISTDIRQCSESVQKLKQANEELTRQKRWIETHPADTNWSAIEVSYETSSFSELFEQYEKHSKDLQKQSSDIKTKIDHLRSVFRQLMGKPDNQALVLLQQELDSIPEQEKSINDEWKRIFTSFAAHCKGMIDSVDAIDSYLAVLNRLLSKEQISNLQSVKITLEKNKWYRHIQNIKEWKEHDLPLFGGLDQDAIDKLQNAVKPLLEKVKVSISDLYDLKLLVTDVHGNSKSYDSLNLESNGTSITVKTIIYISMINEAMKGKQSLGESIRIPFYIDEIDSLDDFNAENIHDIALKLGLIPIFASPKGSGICKRLYQLDNNTRGKLTIHQKDSQSGKLLLVKPTFERVA